MQVHFIPTSARNSDMQAGRKRHVLVRKPNLVPDCGRMHAPYLTLLRDIAPLLAAGGGWAWKKWKVRGNSRWPMSQAAVWSYRFDAKVPTVVYSYYVDGQYYSGEFEVPKTKQMFSSGSALPIEQRYPQGTSFPIRYNPNNPSLSVPFDLGSFAASRST